MSFTASDLVQANKARPPHGNAGERLLCGIRFLLGSPHAVFDGISIDTRTVRPGDLFFAISGPRNDGHDHLEEAVLKGAAGLVVQTLDERVRFDREQPPALFQVADSVQALQQWA